jgi:Niemann-Pick C1 protein
VSNLAFALGAVFLITLLLIGHPLTSFMVFACVLLTVVQLLGVSWAWDIQLNTVSVVNFVLAVGLAVDYAVSALYFACCELGDTHRHVFTYV